MVSPSTMLLTGLYFLMSSVVMAFDMQGEAVDIIGSVLCAIVGLFWMLELIWHKYFTKALVLILSFWVSSTYAESTWLPMGFDEAFEVERAKAAAADSIANTLDTESPGPDNPSPGPSGECGRCKGTGKIRPDGRIEISCPDCGGDGALSLPEILTIVSAERRNYDENVRRLEKVIAQLEEKRTKNPVVSSSSPLDSAPPAAFNERSVLVKKLSRVKWYAYDRTKNLSAAFAENSPTVLFWTGSWCQPCQKFERDVLKSEFVEEILADALCIKVSAREDVQEDIDFFASHNVKNIPLIQVVHPVSCKRMTVVCDEDFIDNLDSAIKWAQR